MPASRGPCLAFHRRRNDEPWRAPVCREEAGGLTRPARLDLRLVPRYRFSDFTLSTRQRLLVRDGQQLPLIPRYLDLLIFLVERRRDAVHRREIFDRVW